MADREERLAANEALFREVNERINELGDRYGFESVSIVCECANDDCTHSFELTRRDYGDLRSSGTRFAVVPGHETPDVETVVSRHDSYVVIEKVGLGAYVAEHLDPGDLLRSSGERTRHGR